MDNIELRLQFLEHKLLPMCPGPGCYDTTEDEREIIEDRLENDKLKTHVDEEWFLM